MNLPDYLKRERKTQAAFAESVNAALERLGYPPRIRVVQQQIFRYCQGSIPNIPIMRAIYVATNGAVQPNDWYDLPALPEAA